MPPRYGLAGAPPCRPAQPVPQPPPTPNPPHPTTDTHVPPQQGQASKQSQAKPSRTGNTHAGDKQLHKTVDTSLPLLLRPFSSSALAHLVFVFHPTTCSNDAQTLNKMHLLSPAPSSMPCLDDVKTNKQEGTLASYMKRKKTSSKIVV